MKLFGVDIAAEVDRALSSGLLDATLYSVDSENREPGSLTDGVHSVATAHAAKGFLEDYEDYQVDGTIIQRGDRVCVLIANSIADAAMPTSGDRVYIEARTFNIVNVKRDPAAATFVMQVRG